MNAPNEHFGLFDRQTNPDGWQVYAAPLDQVLTTVVVHHSALPLRDGPREIQRVHMTINGFADIAYHFVIDDGGRLFEGRSLHVRGAHNAGTTPAPWAWCYWGTSSTPTQHLCSSPP